MHQVIYALVAASATDQALSRTTDVFDQLVGVAPHAKAMFDHYVTFDSDPAAVADSARWGDLPVTASVDLEDSQELLESG